MQVTPHPRMERLTGPTNTLHSKAAIYHIMPEQVFAECIHVSLHSSRLLQGSIISDQASSQASPLSQSPPLHGHGRFGSRTAPTSPRHTTIPGTCFAAMADLMEPNKPSSSYWIWIGENRAQVMKEAGTGKVFTHSMTLNPHRQAFRTYVPEGVATFGLASEVYFSRG